MALEIRAAGVLKRKLRNRGKPHEHPRSYANYMCNIQKNNKKQKLSAIYRVLPVNRADTIRSRGTSRAIFLS